MSEFKVSSRYAKALLDLSIEQGVLDSVRKDVEQFVSVLKSNLELQAVLKNPIINHDKKINILTALFGDKFEATLISFFKIMINKGRAEILYGTAQEFINAYNIYKGIVIAKVTSAAALSEENQRILQQLIKESTGNEVIIERKVNPELIGGFVVTIGDKQIDASLAGRLNKLDRAFHA